ncbi:Glycosyltransferase AglJ [uncultured archaeon]|nr:Glycosyltransferase AglJ [uncultured archaeon]
MSGWRKVRSDSSGKKTASWFFNRLVRLLSGVPLHDVNCGLKAYRREALSDLSLYGELHRYIPVILMWEGYAVGEVEVTNHPRLHGKSKYGLTRLFKGMLDLLTVKFLGAYGTRPLHFFGPAGAFLFGCGFVSGIYLLYVWAFRGGIGERPLLILSVLLMMVGVQLVSMGLIGEMITRLSWEARNRRR